MGVQGLQKSETEGQQEDQYGKKKHPDSFRSEDYNLEEKIKEAQNLLERNQDFQSHLDAIKDKIEGGAGHFSEVRKHQIEILQGTNDGNPLTKTDETPINSSFIILF